MARLKLLAFVVTALGLWGYHLSLVAPLATSGATEQAQAATAGAVGPLAVALESRRSLVQAAALKVAGGSASWNATKAGAKAEAPTADRFAAVRAAAAELVTADLKEQLLVAVSNEQGLLWAKGAGEAASGAPAGLDAQGLGEAGAAGAVRSLDGTTYFLVSVPMLSSDKNNEVRPAGQAIVGLPLLPDEKALEGVVQALGLKSLAIAGEGKALVAAGDKAGLAELLSLKADSSGNLGRGPVRSLGPLSLPMMTDVPHGVGTRRPLPGTPFEVVASASSRAALEALAGYQVFGLGALVGLLLLGVVLVILSGGGEEQAPAMVMPAPIAVPPAQPRPEPLAPRAPPPPIAIPDEASAPEASPDDFDFPVSSQVGQSPAAKPAGSTGQAPAFSPMGQTGQAPAFNPPAPPPPPVSTGLTGQTPAFEPGGPSEDPFAQAEPPPPPPTRAPPPPPAPVLTSEVPSFQPSAIITVEDEGQRTVAYPAFKPPLASAPPPAPPAAADPFAMAAAQEEDKPLSDENVESTRVAAVPAELLKAARQASGTMESPAFAGSRPSTAAMPRVAAIAPAGSGGDEDRHFQDVFRDFVATREKCKEPADGLTFDKFRVKLLKNKEQLVAKYNCKSVRFQVYVKDGKAALKATPVKE